MGSWRRALAWGLLLGAWGCGESPTRATKPERRCVVRPSYPEWEPFSSEDASPGAFAERGRTLVLPGGDFLGGESAAFLIFFEGEGGLYVSARDADGNTTTAARLLVPGVGRWTAAPTEQGTWLAFTLQGGDALYLSRKLERPVALLRPAPGRELTEVALGVQGRALGIAYSLKTSTGKSEVGLYLADACALGADIFCESALWNASITGEDWLRSDPREPVWRSGALPAARQERRFVTAPATAGPFLLGEGRGLAFAPQGAEGFWLSWTDPTQGRLVLSLPASAEVLREQRCLGPRPKGSSCTPSAPAPLPVPLGGSDPLLSTNILSESAALGLPPDGAGLSLVQLGAPTARPLPLPAGAAPAKALGLASYQEGGDDYLAALWAPRSGGGLRFVSFSYLDPSSLLEPPLWVLPQTPLRSASMALLPRGVGQPLRAGISYQLPHGQVGFVRILCSF